MTQSDDERLIGDLVRSYADTAPEVARPDRRDRRSLSWTTWAAVAGVLVAAVIGGTVAAAVIRLPTTLVGNASASPVPTSSIGPSPSDSTGATASAVPSASPSQTLAPTPSSSTSATPTAAPSLTAEDLSLDRLEAVWEPLGFECFQNTISVPETPPGDYVRCNTTIGDDGLSIRATSIPDGDLLDINMSAIAAVDGSLTMLEQHAVASLFSLAPVPGESPASLLAWINDSLVDSDCVGTDCVLETDAANLYLQTGERGSFGLIVQYCDVATCP